MRLGIWLINAYAEPLGREQRVEGTHTREDTQTRFGLHIPHCQIVVPRNLDINSKVEWVDG